MTDLIFTDILAKLDRAAVNGTKLHLDVNLVRALATSPVYATLAEMKAKEFALLWQKEKVQAAGVPAASNSAPSGSGTEQIAMIGESAGTMTAEQEASVGLAASRQASEAVAQINRQKRRKTH